VLANTIRSPSGKNCLNIWRKPKSWAGPEISSIYLQVAEKLFLQVAQKVQMQGVPKPGTRPEGVGLSTAFYAKKSREMRRT
jgi:hypothetical protein